MKIARYKFEDEGQDLMYIDVKLFGDDFGMIVDTSPVPYKELYINKAFKESDNRIGDNFNYADPKQGFQVYQLKYKIESIETLN